MITRGESAFRPAAAYQGHGSNQVVNYINIRAWRDGQRGGTFVVGEEYHSRRMATRASEKRKRPTRTTQGDHLCPNATRIGRTVF